MTNLRIYVINLDRSKERLTEITRQLNELGLQFERISAIDGKLANDTQRACINEQAYQKKHGKQSLPGELGCYLSHVKAIQTFLNTNDEFALILEDDAVFGADFVQVITRLLANSARWDMVKLSGVHSGTPVNDIELNPFYRLAVMFSKCTGSSAYVINRKAALAYYQKLLPMTLPYDHEFDLGWKYRIKVRAVNPFPVIHNDMVSTTIISDPISNRKIRGFKRFPTHLYRLKTEFSRLFYAISQYIIRKLNII